MTSSTITRRYATLFALSALALAVAAPNAPASTGSSSPSQDLRSPDARDAAAGYDPEPVADAVPEPSGSGDGFDWVSGAIGAAAVGGLILLLFAFMNGRGVIAVSRREDGASAPGTRLP